MRRHAKAPAAGSTSGTSSRSGQIRRGFPALGALALLVAIVFTTTSAFAAEELTSHFGGTGTTGGLLTGAGGDAVNETGEGGVPAGSVYVADTTNNRVDQFTASGTFIRAWGEDVVASGSPIADQSDAVQTVTVKATGGGFTLTPTTGTGTGTTTTSSNEVTGLSTTTGSFHVGDTISGTGIPSSPATTITEVNGTTLKLSANATASGTPTLTVKETTTAIEADAPANSGTGNVQSALLALPGIGSGNLTVTGGPGNALGSHPYILTFIGALGGLAQPNVAATVTATLTGGLGSGANTVAVASANAGATGFEVCTAANGDTCKAGITSAKTGGAMSAPTDVAVNQETGDVYVYEKGFVRVDEFSATGSFIRTWGANVVKEGPDQANEVRALTVAATGGTYSLTFGGQTTGATGTGATAIGSVEVTSLTTATGAFVPGEEISGEGIPAGTTIASVTGTTLTLSQEVTATASGVALTAQLPYDASASAVQAALAALSSIGSGDVEVSGGPGNELGVHPYIVTFTGSLGGATEGAITATTTALTGTATVTFAKMHTGATGFEVCTAANGDVCESGALTGGDSALGGGFGGASAFANHLAVAASTGDVVVGDSGSRRVQEFDPTGRFILALGAGVISSGPDSKGSTSSSRKFEVCVNAQGDVCKAAESGTGGTIIVGQFGTESPTFLAVDSTGAIYATDKGNSRVQKFTPGATPAEIAPSVFAESKLSGSPAPTALAIEPNPDGDRLLAVKPSGSESQVLEFTSDGSLAGAHYVGTGLPAATGLAYNSASSNLYYSTTAGDAALPANSVGILSFTPVVVTPPTATVSQPTSVTTRSATLNGAVDPEGFGTTYQFEYSVDGANWAKAPAVPAEAGSGTSSVEVHRSVTGLRPHATYYVRLVARNGGGTVTSAQTSFQTAPEPPDVSQVVASPVTATTAKLTAYINPNNSPTSYRFEWGTSASYGSQSPEFEPFLGEGGKPLPVRVTISGLRPETAYHFRLVAANGNSGGAGTTESSDEEFTTLSTACPNQRLREESNINPATGHPYSIELGECRAFEQVTPPYKEGSSVLPAAAQFQYAINTTDASRLIEENLGVYAGQENPDQSGSLYEIARDPGSGWKSKPLDPSGVEFTGHGPNLPGSQLEGRVPTGLDAYPGATLWNMDPTSGPSTGIEGLYLRGPEGEFTSVGPLSPPGTTVTENQGEGFETGYEGVRGASDNLSHLVFALKRQSSATVNVLWPGDATVKPTSPGVINYSIYEYVGTGNSGEDSEVPTLLGVDNEGHQITTCGTLLGGPKISGVPQEYAVSAQGSTVFLTALAGGCAGGGTGPAVNQLYARVGAEPATAIMVNVAGASTCASDSCGVTVAPQFQGASEDGSKVFFTTTQALSPADRDTTADLYECELPGDSGAHLAAETPVDHCPSLVPISATGASEGASVQGIVAISEDGSHVYYVAKGVVTSAPNSQGQSAEAGANNLYVSEPDPAHPTQRRTVFITTLATADSSDWELNPGHKAAQTTPDGHYLLFSSTADLTPDDTSTVAQLFRYDAHTDDLIRVSAGQNGYDDDGNTDVNPAAIRTKPQYGPSSAVTNLALADDGTVVFVTHQALVPGASSGGSGTCMNTSGQGEPTSGTTLCNIYVYSDGNLSLISDGKPITSGGVTAIPLSLSRSGDDVFFTTSQQLVAQDTDTTDDIYDARIDGGFPAPEILTPCNPLEDGSCQGPPTPAPASSGNPTTLAFSGPGNEPTSPAAKKHKKKGHKKHKKKGHKKHANRSHRRAASHHRGGSR